MGTSFFWNYLGKDDFFNILELCLAPLCDWSTASQKYWVEAGKSPGLQKSQQGDFIQGLGSPKDLSTRILAVSEDKMWFLSSLALTEMPAVQWVQ